MFFKNWLKEWNYGTNTTSGSNSNIKKVDLIVILKKSGSNGFVYKKAHNPHSTQRCPNGTCLPFPHCREKEDAQILADRASFFLSCPVPLTSSTWAARTTSQRKMLRFSRTVVAFYAGFTAIDRPVQAKRYNGLVVACRGAWRWNGWQKTPSQAGALHDGVEQLDLASEGGLSPITSWRTSQCVSTP